ncbi:MAG: histidine phosphatase family protein [Bacteroidetes bacterium]|nr:histidine phosphatase family protein [Bacteroidota bacterium]
MKHLFLVRHAKSDWSYDGLPDIDRPLNERGYRDAHYMSKQLAEKKQLPDAIISSPAIRAVNTALIFSRNFNFPENKITINKGLYETSPENFITLLAGIEDKFKSVYLFSHNPTITKVANILSGRGIDNIPTCGIVCLEFDSTSWKAAETARFKWFDFPKNHMLH